MPNPPGHETGHPDGRHIVDAFTWREYVHALRTELGGWTALALALQERAEDDLVDDPESVITGLKRLARSGQRPGGKYGTLLLRVFGLPPSISRWGSIMGQYHSRFADLPVGLRREQLLRWDRPPVSESPAAMWVHIGLASLAHRDRDLDEARRRLRLASDVRRPEPAARLEYELLRARLASDDGDLDGEAAAMEAAQVALEAPGLSEEDGLCYQARLLDQRAFRASRGWRSDAARLEEAIELYRLIPDVPTPPFVAFRRALGEAWCLWRMGQAGRARDLAVQACEHAGDGGLVRLRVMGLNLLANIHGDSPDGRAVQDRALRLTRALDDADLAARVQRQGYEAPSSTPRTP